MGLSVEIRASTPEEGYAVARAGRRPTGRVIASRHRRSDRGPAVQTVENTASEDPEPGARGDRLDLDRRARVPAHRPGVGRAFPSITSCMNEPRLLQLELTAEAAPAASSGDWIVPSTSSAMARLS